jgi:hypothetical protein
MELSSWSLLAGSTTGSCDMAVSTALAAFEPE